MMLRALASITITLLLAGLLLAGCGTDNSGQFPLDNLPPDIVIAGITNGATVTGIINIAATATDHFGLKEFTLDVDGIQAASNDGGSITYAWNTGIIVNGTHTLLFTAEDDSNNVATETLVVTVANGGGGGDTTDPVIAVTGITSGTTVSGTVAIHATATDNVGVSAFTMKRDGVVVAIGVGGVIDYAWNTALGANAAHDLLFEASDAAGNAAAVTVSVTVNNGGTSGNSISGTVLAQNGVDRIAGALIYVPQDGNATGSENETDDGAAPDDPHFAYAYSLADGTFTLDNVPQGAQLVIIIKGAFHKLVNVNVAAGANALAAADTTLPATGGGGGTTPQIAVVTGNYDHIQNVLAKMGMGDVDSSGVLVEGSQHFTLIDGNDSLDNTTAYPNFDTFFSSQANLDAFDVIFINCGNNYEDWFFSTPAAVSALKNWVEAGGRLYCSDWSYDFVEQLWPDRINFFGSDSIDGLSAVAETRDAAAMGVDMASVDATIVDDNLRAWLDQSSVNVLNNDNTATISDWLVAWVVTQSAAAGTKTWVQAPVQATGEAGTTLRPLTISFQAGSGTVLFSCYHTEETPSASFTTNDRILEYLLLEVLF
jgi:hypothetical protein